MDTSVWTKYRAGSLGVVVLGCMAVLAGCDDHVVVDRDPGVKIQKGMTWAWRPAPPAQEMRSDGGRRVISRDVIPQRNAPPQREFPAHADPEKDLVHTRTRIAIEQILASKKLKQVTDPAAADFLVDYQVGVENKRERVAEPVNPPVLVCGYYGCWNSWGYWGPAGYVMKTVHYSEGTIVFDLVRRIDDKMAYRATYGKKLDSNGLDQEHVNEGMKKMLEKLKPTK